MIQHEEFVIFAALENASFLLDNVIVLQIRKILCQLWRALDRSDDLLQAYCEEEGQWRLLQINGRAEMVLHLLRVAVMNHRGQRVKLRQLREHSFGTWYVQAVFTVRELKA